MRTDFRPCTYILASQRNGTIYIGIASNLVQRMAQHCQGVTGGFAAEYRTYRVVRFELLGTMELTIAREKQLKNWHRQWKINLIERDNQEWRDLAFDVDVGSVGLTVDAETSSA